MPVTESSWWIVLGIVLLVAVVLGGTWLVRGHRTSRGSDRSEGPDRTAAQPGLLRPDREHTDLEPTNVEQADGGEHGAGQGAGQGAAGSAAPAAELDVPEPVGGRLARLRARLARSGSPFGARLLAVLSRDGLSEDDWDEIEETLLLADIGAGPAVELVDDLRTEVRVRGLQGADGVRALLREKLIALVDPAWDRSLAVTRDGAAGVPAVVLVVGVNGGGKTTTVGKLTRVLVAEGKSVLLVAADTFRAAAADQLTTWGSRVGVETVRSDRDGADPASVAFDGVRAGKEREVDVVLVDTAGRLQNKAGLMDELGKVTRVITKEAPLSEVLLVLDATTGQNGLSQARVFTEVAGVTGIVLTKLDGTAKGGIVVAVQRELGVPVKLVGLGEGADDLAPFDPEQFVDGLLGV